MWRSDSPNWKAFLMSDLLWQKPGVEVDARIMRFLAGDDVVLDREFFLHDITASKVHVEGLQRIGILGAEEAAALARELDVLATDFRSGAFVLDVRYEDGHSAIEARLSERLGDTGRKVHTGRSRNDQILVATRLCLATRICSAPSCRRPRCGSPALPRRSSITRCVRTIRSPGSMPTHSALPRAMA
jgi:argininosuccinate lyase